MALVLKLLGGKTSQAEVTMELEWDLKIIREGMLSRA